MASEEELTWESLRARSLQPGGFGEDRIRIWPALLGVQPLSDPPPYSEVENTAEHLNAHTPDGGYGYEDADPHPDERQIKLDTDRSFVLYPPEPSTISRDALQNDLHALILSLFRKRRSLHYFQGLHDIVSVLFLTLPSPLHLPCVEKMALHRVRDAMGIGLEPVVGLLRLVDPEYAAVLESASPLPFHALSNLLTLFSHDIPTLRLIQHVWDFLLVREPIAVVWLAATIILHRKPSIEMLIEQDEEGMIHSLLSALPELADDEPECLMNGKAPTEGNNESIHDKTSDNQASGRETCCTSGSDEEGLHRSPAAHHTNGGQPAESVAQLDLEVSDSTPSLSDTVNSSVKHEDPLSDGPENRCMQPNESVPPAGHLDRLTEPETKIDFEEVEQDNTETSTSYRNGRANSITSMTRLRSPSLSNHPLHENPRSPSDSDVLHTGTSIEMPPASETETESLLTAGQATPLLASEDSVSQPPTPCHRRKPSYQNKPPISLACLLHQADALLAAYPPSHPALRVHEIMGKDSVVQTWRPPTITGFRDIPDQKWESDDFLESLVNSQDIVIPSPPPSPVLRPYRPGEKRIFSPRRTGKMPLGLRHIGWRLGLLTPRERRLVLAGALLVVGVAIMLKANKVPGSEWTRAYWQDRWTLFSSLLTLWGKAPWS
ncbi:hypothetical protein ID866_4906 [Astraeus odoratus]|nr:hypothetical protein ID866_4906 [Astraeus odoratus]